MSITSKPSSVRPHDVQAIRLIFVERLLDYARNVRFTAPYLSNVSQHVMLHLVLFEIFHHEFYHHLVESAATTIEIIADAMGAPVPSYAAYRFGIYSAKFDWHEHNPLEEALANAYAFHALAFISRVKTGYRDALVGSYQRNLEVYWSQEGAGYRNASAYLSGAQIHGNAELLAMILDRKPHRVLDQIAQSVMPTGFAAFVSKPDIPAYLVGQPEEISDFHKMVPAPNETYCHLFWPFDTSKIDVLLKARYAERKTARAQTKNGR